MSESIRIAKPTSIASAGMTPENWVGLVGRHGTASRRDLEAPQDEFVAVRRPVVSLEQARAQVASLKPLYQSLMGAADNSVPVDAFYASLEALVAREAPLVVERIDNAMAAADALFKQGLNPVPPVDRTAWRRAAVQTYLHTRDLAVVMRAMGYDAPDVVGVHDLVEFVPIADLEWQMSRKSYPAWFGRLVTALRSDPDIRRQFTQDGEGERVNISVLGPFGSAMYKWGDAREDANALMDPHRLSPHHNGNSDEDITAPTKGPQRLGPKAKDALVKQFLATLPAEAQTTELASACRGYLDYDFQAFAQRSASDYDAWVAFLGKSYPKAPMRNLVEKYTNFLQHHMPREHFGVRHLPRGDWANLEHALATDPAISHSELGKRIARDIAPVWQALEQAGLVTPWQKLAVPNAVPMPAIERAYEALQGQNASADKRLAMSLGAAAKVELAPDHPLRRFEAKLLNARADQALVKAWQELQPAKTETQAYEVWRHVGVAVAAKFAQVSVRSSKDAQESSGAIAEISELLGQPANDYLPESELLRSIAVMEQLPKWTAVAHNGKDPLMAGTLRSWHRIWQQGFAFPQGDL